MPQGSHIRVLTGLVFTRLTVEGRAPNKPYIGNAVWHCRCECGRYVDVVGHKLTIGHTKSCGCLKNELIGERRRKHGSSNTREYHAWCAAKQRCHNPKTSHYHMYGGRGIVMCQPWRDSFEVFLRDIGPAPTQRHSIDRIDGNRGYEPGNVRWADPFQQANNTRANRRITFQGETLTVAQWERRLGFAPDGIKARLLAGWSEERAMTTPKRKGNYRKGNR